MNDRALHNEIVLQDFQKQRPLNVRFMLGTKPSTFIGEIGNETGDTVTVLQYHNGFFEGAPPAKLAPLVKLSAHCSPKPANTCPRRLTSRKISATYLNYIDTNQALKNR